MPRSHDDQREDLGRMAFGILLLLGWLFLTASVLSYSPWDFPSHFVYHELREVRNFAGLPGAWCAYALAQCVGVAAYFVPLAFGVCVILYWFCKEIRDLWLKTIGFFLMLTALAGFAAFLYAKAPGSEGPIVGPAIGPGGAAGALIKFLFEKFFKTAGAYVALTGVFLAGLMLVVPDAVLKYVIWLSGLGRMVGQIARPFRVKLERSNPSRKPSTPATTALTFGQAPAPARPRFQNDCLSTPARPAVSVTGASSLRNPRPLPAPSSPSVPSAPVVAAMPALAADSRPDVQAPYSQPEYSEELPVEDREANYEPDDRFYRNTCDYQFPSIETLSRGDTVDPQSIEDMIAQRGAILESACKEYRVDVKVVGYETGPVLTMYEVELSRSLRVKTLVSLEQDLAVRMAVPHVRIVSPLPGKNTVGVEIPNRVRLDVRLRDVMEDCGEDAQKMFLPLFLGQDVVGKSMTVDLSTLPHLLIAGSTGTGKSVCLNTIIMSLIMTRTPDQVRMIMIDPKMVELSPYKNIPHLMHPVITDMEKASAVLEWAIEQMEERYRIMNAVGVRKLEDFNELPLEVMRERLRPADEDEWAVFPKTMSRIVIIADEFADLIMTVGKDVHTHIARLAQKSRAVGIHLILATQKPTRDVVTGLIKSNLPARISFKVASQIDSRIVFDRNAAEKLLGRGDMFFKPPTTDDLTRGQGAFVTDEEIRAVLSQINVAHPDFQIVISDKPAEEDDGLDDEDEIQYDKYYVQAVEFCIAEGRASASSLQRAFKIGYNRAARIVDVMTKEGIVSPPNPARPSLPRSILITMEQWNGSRNDVDEAMNPLTAGINASKPQPEVEAASDPESAPVRETSYNATPVVSAASAAREQAEIDDVEVQEISLAPNPPRKADVVVAPPDADPDPTSEPDERPVAEGWDDARWAQYLDYDAEIDG